LSNSSKKLPKRKGPIQKLKKKRYLQNKKKQQQKSNNL